MRRLLCAALTLTSAAGYGLAGCGSESTPVPGGVVPDGSFIIPDASPGPDGGLLRPEAAVPPPPPPDGPGHISFKHPDDTWRRVLATTGSPLENLTAEMNKVSPGKDDFLNLSRDGAWVVATGARFGCGSGSCVELFAGNLSRGEGVKPNGHAIEAGEGRPVVAPGGNLIVYSKSGPHALDLYAVTRNGTLWDTPVLLTTLSTFSHHHDAAISSDGARVVFDCGRDAYGAPPTAICEVGTDGNGFHKIIDPADGPDHAANHAAHHPDYAPDGSVVFEVDWGGEQIWKLPVTGGPAVNLSGGDYPDDNSPCVLPDGRIASLWLGRKGNTEGSHEIKIMNADGSSPFMLVTGIDVVDIGMGCGN